MTRPGFLDLHCHTSFSDGSFTPEEVVDQAATAGVTTLAITDHDDVGYWPRAKAAADVAGIRLIPGVELSASHRGTDVHILGYGLNPDSVELRDDLAHYRNERASRAKRMVRLLQRLGLTIEFTDVLGLAEHGAIGRPHVARHLVNTGQVPSVQAAFDLYLGDGRPAYQDKAFLSPAEACAVIHDAGGVAVVAHPVIKGVDSFIPDLAAAGLDGIEVMHPQQDAGDRHRLGAYADEYDLLKTGGSDFHGTVKPEVHFGDVQTPLDWLAPLDEAIAAVQGAAGISARRT